MKRGMGRAGEETIQVRREGGERYSIRACPLLLPPWGEREGRGGGGRQPAVFGLCTPYPLPPFNPHLETSILVTLNTLISSYPQWVHNKMFNFPQNVQLYRSKHANTVSVDPQCVDNEMYNFPQKFLLFLVTRFEMKSVEEN
jgi:hypothetical protein